MTTDSVMIILGIMFWVLCALAIVCAMAWVFVYLQYYRWDKQDRLESNIIQKIQEQVGERIEQEKDLGGGNQDLEN